MRPIDADALIDEIKRITGQDAIMWFDNRKIKREQEVNIEALIERIPTVEPTLYGYKLETLAVVAAVMNKQGVTPEKAVEIYQDVSRIVQMAVDERADMVKKTVEQYTF